MLMFLFFAFIGCRLGKDELNSCFEFNYNSINMTLIGVVQNPIVLWNLYYVLYKP